MASAMQPPMTVGGHDVSLRQATHVTDAWAGAASPGVCPESTAAGGHVSSELADPLPSGPAPSSPRRGLPAVRSAGP